MNPTHLSPSVHIACNGEPVCMLRAYLGNNVGQLGIWSPTLDRVDASLRQWSKSHPTYDGKCLITNMVVGGMTQYLTCVQGMPIEIEQALTKCIQQFINDDSPVPMIGLPVFQQAISKGSK